MSEIFEAIYDQECRVEGVILRFDARNVLPEDFAALVRAEEALTNPWTYLFFVRGEGRQPRWAYELVIASVMDALTRYPGRFLVASWNGKTRTYKVAGQYGTDFGVGQRIVGPERKLFNLYKEEERDLKKYIEEKRAWKLFKALFSKGR